MTEKVTFTQAEGCFNDGSFEFCIPADDAAALAAVLKIAPDTQCVRAGGRAHCNRETQVLCLVSTRSMCNALSKPMTDAGWQTVCDLSSLPFVQKIVPTFYE